MPHCDCLPGPTGGGGCDIVTGDGCPAGKTPSLYCRALLGCSCACTTYPDGSMVCDPPNCSSSSSSGGGSSSSGGGSSSSGAGSSSSGGSSGSVLPSCDVGTWSTKSLCEANAPVDNGQWGCSQLWGSKTYCYPTSGHCFYPGCVNCNRPSENWNSPYCGPHNASYPNLPDGSYPPGDSSFPGICSGYCL